MAQYEKKQKELKNLCIEEGQLKRALAMKLDKESKQNIRRQKKREMKEQHVQEVLGYLIHTWFTTAHFYNIIKTWFIGIILQSVLQTKSLKKTNHTHLNCSPGSVTRSIRSVRKWPRKSKRSPVRRSSWRPRSRVWEMCAAKRLRELR